jgi:type VI secretion system secreted protein Hcp
MPVDLYLVIPPSPTNPPITADPVQDQYFKTTFQNAVAVPILQFSFGEQNTVTIGSATGGAGAGKAQLKELVLEKSVDKLTRSLFSLSVTGGHLAKAQLYVRKAGGGTGKPYLVYAFDMVFVSRIDWSASSGDEQPLETVTLAYGGLAIGYYPQKPDGTFDTPVRATWSQVTNTDVVSPDILAGF